MIRCQLDPKREIPVIGIRILEKQFAEDFVNNGIVHFSFPSNWKDETLMSGLQLDKYEGCFCYSTCENDEWFKKIGRKFERIKEGNTFRYYEKNSRLMACCIYGLNKSEFVPGIMRYGRKIVDTLDARVTKKYFDKFNEQEIEKKSVILIFDMPAFLNIITSKLIEMGCREQDILALPVYYVPKKMPFVSIEPFPFEYFLKDSMFKEQSEFRILINCDDEEFWERFKSNDYNLVLGNISNIATVQDYYQEDLCFSIQDNELVFNLATPVETHIIEMSFKEIVGILYQTLQNQLPGEPISNDEINTRVNYISDVLLNRFGIKYCDDWRLENVPISLFRELPKLHQGMCRSIIDDEHSYSANYWTDNIMDINPD